ncbi:hypothetical protein ABT369_38975 [Dactylosporangium sp. NPDC000244]|uniref:hypothetical protein n=1 Tax=Dactylosporangium sp. NPDC000244 TaxID=3154365 RepID=UPI0033221F71
MIQPTWDNVCTVIRDGDDDLYAIADALGQHPGDLDEKLAEMVDKGLLYRWPDNGVTRYGICRERRVA